jgi:hypothetical protein
MNSMTEIYEQLSAKDAVLLEKQAAQMKLAEEEDAAGRIMARGFADELAKLANMPGQTVPDTPNDLGAIKNYRLGPKGATGVNAAGQKVQSNAGGFMTPTKPPAPKPPATAQQQPR